MMDDNLLYNKINSLPDALKAEVEDFIDFLKTKSAKEKPNKPRFGSGKGMFVILPGFDEPLDDFNEYTN